MTHGLYCLTVRYQKSLQSPKEEIIVHLMINKKRKNLDVVEFLKIKVTKNINFIILPTDREKHYFLHERKN